MIPIYIKKHKEKKKRNFKTDIYIKLDKSPLVMGDHYIMGELSSNDTVLCWITSRITLKDLKRAIGYKTILRHRLQFFTNINDLIPKTDSKPSKSDVALMLSYKERDKKLKHNYNS